MQPTHKAPGTAGNAGCYQTACRRVNDAFVSNEYTVGTGTHHPRSRIIPTKLVAIQWEALEPKMTTTVRTAHTVQTMLFPIQPRLLTVRRISTLTPRMCRVTLGGADLARFQTAAPTDHVKCFFPAPGAHMPVMPVLGERGIVPPAPDAPQPISRDYTVRAFRVEPMELDIDFVLHGQGPAVTWVQRARPGDVLGVLGPRGAHVVPDDFDWVLLAGDETAVPAIARWVAEAPATAHIIAVIEVADFAEEQALATWARLDLTWLHRDGAEAGTTTLLPDTIRALDLPSGDGYAWVAGEADTLRAIRRHLRQERGMPAEWVDVDGYWRRGVINLDHHAPLDE